jgi:hypothetical protein
MDSVSIYYKNMADAMTYDGNMLFGHDRRNYIPLKIDLSARGQWLPKDSKNRDSRDKRLYAHEVCVPDDYMIVDAETYTPTSTYEEARIIRVNKQQIAIPMKWFFKMKDMTIYEQWDFLRAYRQDLPFHLKSTPYLTDALNRAYEMGIETQFMTLFYDMERDDPKEFERRKHLLGNKKKAVKLEMKACLSEINKLRATTDGNWPELLEELYANYSSSNLFRVMNFIEYCKFAAKANDKYLVALEEVQRIHSVVWYISMMTDDYIGLDEKLQELEKQKEFDTSLYSFGFF